MNDYQDKLHRFVFDDTPIRGNTINLSNTFKATLEKHNYPPILRQVLGELMAASALLAATIKMLNGALILQIMGNGPIRLLVVECSTDFGLRATAKWQGSLNKETFSELVGDGHFIITLDPKDGGQSYQGIVPLEGKDISEVLENYMERSEQIPTRIWLSCDGESAAGLLLQKVPDHEEADSDAWKRTCVLANTVKSSELLELDARSLLIRLFHEEKIRVFDPKLTNFKCTCSRNNVGKMLKTLGKKEIEDILAEQGSIEIHCEFCNARYAFDEIDARQLFETRLAPSSVRKH